MPIYEYKCENGHLFEAVQRMVDDSLSECELCAAPAERVFSPIAVHFKGTGFYATDYGSRKAGNSATDADGDGGGSDGSDSKEGSSDSSSSESKSSESKSSDSKSSDSGSSDSKSSGSGSSDSGSAEKAKSSSASSD